MQSNMKMIWKKYQWPILGVIALILLLAVVFYLHPFGWFAAPCPEVCRAVLPANP
jgi:hypothetical protein